MAGPGGVVRCLGAAGADDEILPIDQHVILRISGAHLLAVAPPGDRLRRLDHPVLADPLPHVLEDGRRLSVWTFRGGAASVDVLTGAVRRRRHLELAGGIRLDPLDLEVTDTEDRAILPRRPPAPAFDGDVLIGVDGGIVDLDGGEVRDAGLLQGALCGRSAGSLFWLHEDGHGAWTGRRREVLRVPVEEDDPLVEVRHGAGVAFAVARSGRAWRLAPGVEPQRSLPPDPIPETTDPWWRSLGFTHVVVHGAWETAWAADGRCARRPAPTRR